MDGDTQESINLRINKDGSVFLTKEGLIKKEKQINPQTLLDLIRSSLKNEVIKQIYSGPLPKGTVFYGHLNRENICEEIVVIHRPACVRTYNHFGRCDEVGYPALLFGFRVACKKIVSSYLVAVTDEVILDSSIIYHFPYANIYSDGRICWGNYKTPNINHLAELNYQPEAFYFIEHTHERNAAGQVIGELLQKAREEKFDSKLLVPLGTFKQLIKRLGN